MFLATAFQGSLLDFIVVALLIFFSLIGLRQGFFNRLIGIIGGIASFVLAVSLCKPFASLLQAIFNIEGALSGSFTKSFAKNKQLNVAITDSTQVAEILSSQEFLPAFIRNTAVKVAKATSGKTLAKLLGDICAKFVNIAISFVIIIILVKIICFILKKIFAKIEDDHDGVFLVNKILGVIIGFLHCLLIICLILFLVDVLPSGAFGWLQRTVAKSKVCKFLTKHNFIVPIFKMLLGFN